MRRTLLKCAVRIIQIRLPLYWIQCIPNLSRIRHPPLHQNFIGINTAVNKRNDFFSVDFFALSLPRKYRVPQSLLFIDQIGQSLFDRLYESTPFPFPIRFFICNVKSNPQMLLKNCPSPNCSTFTGAVLLTYP